MEAARSVLCFSIMACAYKAPVAFLDGMETQEPMGSLGHLGFRDGTG